MSTRATRSQSVELNAGLKFPQRSRCTDGRPDLIALYNHLNDVFFDGELNGSGYTISWGQNMRTTSGFTDLYRREIKISWDIHRLQPEKELISTVLHEMIHAKMYRLRLDDDSRSHAGFFLEEIERINRMGPFKVLISIYVTYTDSKCIFA